MRTKHFISLLGLFWSVVVFAQESTSELKTEIEPHSLIKLLVQSENYDGKLVTVIGYVSRREDNGRDWRLFLDASACMNFDYWNSVIVDISSEVVDSYDAYLSSESLPARECFVERIAGKYHDMSRYNLWTHSLPAVGVISEVTLPNIITNVGKLE